MNIGELFALLILAAYFAMLFSEQFGAGRRRPQIRFGRTRGVLFFLVPMIINAVLPSLVPPQRAQAHLLDGGRPDPAGNPA